MCVYYEIQTINTDLAWKMCVERSVQWPRGVSEIISSTFVTTRTKNSHKKYVKRYSTTYRNVLYVSCNRSISVSTAEGRQ